MGGVLWEEGEFELMTDRVSSFGSVDSLVTVTSSSSNEWSEMTKTYKM